MTYLGLLQRNFQIYYFPLATCIHINILKKAVLLEQVWFACISISMGRYFCNSHYKRDSWFPVVWLAWPQFLPLPFVNKDRIWATVKSCLILPSKIRGEARKEQHGCSHATSDNIPCMPLSEAHMWTCPHNIQSNSTGYSHLLFTNCPPPLSPPPLKAGSHGAQIPSKLPHSRGWSCISHPLPQSAGITGEHYHRWPSSLACGDLLAFVRLIYWGGGRCHREPRACLRSQEGVAVLG